MCGKVRGRCLERVFLGIPLRYWIIAVVCWVLSGICLYLMFIFTSIEIDLVLSALSILLGLSSIVSLSIGATKRDFQLLRESLSTRLDSLEQTVREGFNRQEGLLKQMLEELRRR